MKNITYRDVSSSWRFMLDVWLNGKKVGTIWHEEKGFRYYPKGSDTGGNAFITLFDCKLSLEAE
jgi:hypothetical protein